MASYDVYHSWAEANVAFWILHDEYLYKMACEASLHASSKDKAADALLEALHKAGIIRTPNGVRYTKALIHTVLSDL